MENITTDKNTRFHICVFIDGALKRSDRELEGLLSDNGRSLSGKEVRYFLQEQKRLGYERFCGCDNRLPPPDGSCGGHPVTEK